MVNARDARGCIRAFQTAMAMEETAHRKSSLGAVIGRCLRCSSAKKGYAMVISRE